MTVQERAQEYAEKTIPIYGNNPSTMVLGQRQVLIDAFFAGAQSGWVSVIERLPNNDDEVIGLFEFGIGIGKQFNNIILDEQCAYTATHWMPLPSKPII